VQKTERAYCFGDDLWFVPPLHAEKTIDVYLPARATGRICHGERSPQGNGSTGV